MRLPQDATLELYVHFFEAGDPTWLSDDDQDGVWTGMAVRPVGDQDYQLGYFLDGVYGGTENFVGSCTHDVSNGSGCAGGDEFARSLNPAVAVQDGGLKLSYGTCHACNSDDCYARELFISEYVEGGSYNKAVELNPNSADVYNNLASSLNEIGRREDAVVNYQKAIEIQTRFTEAHYNLGNTYTALGRNREAAVSYKKAIELKENFTDAHYNLGKSLFNAIITRLNQY